VSNIQITIKNFEDLIRCAQLSSHLELSGWPKIGNVHRTRNFSQTRYEHFLAGIVAIQPNFISFLKRVSEKIQTKEENLSFIRLGLFFKSAAEDMMKWQSGGNVILGHILILAPLTSAAAICIKLGLTSIKEYKEIVERVINDASLEDTINLYEAIRICNPGGLGKIDKYDIYNDQSFKELIEDRVNLKTIFEYSMDYDLISREYANGFEIIINEGLPYFFDVFNQTKDINTSIVNTYLKLLSTHLDTLIIRKADKNSAIFVSNLALKILKYKGILTRKGLRLAIRYDKKIQQENGKLNPGTTADLMTGIIFCALIFGLKI
jgi:triphosphoribosyl-dephospho-CoA synthase